MVFLRVYWDIFGFPGDFRMSRFQPFPFYARLAGDYLFSSSHKVNDIVRGLFSIIS